NTLHVFKLPFTHDGFGLFKLRSLLCLHFHSSMILVGDNRLHCIIIIVLFALMSVEMRGSLQTKSEKVPIIFLVFEKLTS
ncbi:MAG: hypothetical protein ACQESM_09715, partial [Bacteroidota bacterium]